MLCVRQGPLAALSSRLAPIRDTRRHPRSCVCHTRPLNHRVQDEDAAVIRIYLQPRACSQHAWHKHGHVTRWQKHPLPRGTGTRSLLYRVRPSPFSHVQHGLFFQGPFRALSHISDNMPRETGVSTTTHTKR